MPKQIDRENHSESHLQPEVVFRRMKEMIFQVNREGVIQQFSNGPDTFFKLNADKIRGQNILDLPILVTDEQKEQFKKTLIDAFELQQGYGFDFESDQKNVYLNTYVPVDSGKPDTAWVILGNNELKKDLNDPGISHQHWKSLIDHIPDWISRYDKELRLVFINPEGEKLIGKSNNEVTGKKNQELNVFDPVTCQKLDEKIQQVFKTGRQMNFFYKFEYQGLTRHSFIKIVPEYGVGSDEPNAVITLTRDITNLRDYEEKLNSRNSELNNINHYLNDFVYTVAHDLRSPLTNLRLIADLIKSSKEPTENEFYTENINNSVDRVENILNGIIEIINSQFNVDTVIRELDFLKTLERVKDELILRLKRSNASISYDFKVKKINYPQTYLSSIFRNLLSNAIKYRRSGVDPSIEVFTKKEGEFVVLEFKDNGTGIDVEKNKKRLFKPFKRLNDNQDGKGIGLHLVRSMVEKNGGKIELESELGSGALFRIFLKEYINDI